MSLESSSPSSFQAINQDKDGKVMKKRQSSKSSPLQYNENLYSNIEDSDSPTCTCPSFINYFGIAIVGGVFLLLPAIVIVAIGPIGNYYPPIYIKGFGDSWKFEAFRWSAIFGIGFMSYFATMAIMAIFPIFFNILDSVSESQKDEKMENFLVKRFYLLRKNISWLTTSIATYFMMGLMFVNAPLSSSKIETYLVRGTLGFVLLTIALLTKGLIIQKISINYQSKFLGDRIVNNKIAFECIQRLKRIFPSSPSSHSPLSKTEEERERRLTISPNDLQNQKGKVPLKSKRSLSQSQLQFQSSVSSSSLLSSNVSILTGSTHVNEIAERLYYGLCPYPRESIVLNDLKDYISNEEMARKFFSILDRNANGDVTKKEFFQSIQFIYDERHDLGNSMTQSCKVLDQLDWIIFYLCIGLVAFFSLSIFDLSHMTLLATYGGIGFLIKFLFGNMAGDAFKAAIFVLIIHPFDVSDSIQINGKSLRVKEIGLWSTAFIGEQNKLVYFQNKDLIGTVIGNNRRSHFQTEGIKILISTKATSKQLNQFEEKINDFITRHSRDFSGKLAFKNVLLLNTDCMSLEFEVPHKSNFQHTLQKELRGNIFMMNFNELAHKEKIEYGPYNWDPQIKLI